jgi:hypothetical protein
MELRVSRVFTEPMEHKAQLVQAHKVPQAQTVFRAYKVWAAQMAHKELPEQAHKVPQAVMVSRVYKASKAHKEHKAYKVLQVRKAFKER